MVVVVAAAAPVERLAVLRAEYVDLAGVGQRTELVVDGCQTDPGAAGA